jgi:hypothetical protein
MGALLNHIGQLDYDKLRDYLGIPNDAERVLVFSESSHWDPNWMLTSEEYFDGFVRSNLDHAIEELQNEPRRVYSIECIFFLRLYWERCPTQQDIIRSLVNEGRLRLTSSGVTTADTLLPSAEAILRDLLIGQEWLRENGMIQEPKLAYFTDSFGCSPALPSLLNAAGFDRTAITRLDGMYFMGCDLESPKRFPRPNSSAERLLKQEHSLDFVWRDRNGAQVLCHWNAFTYGQGDMLAYSGITRVYLFRVAFPARSDCHIARRIKQFAAQLEPYSRTPYMFCPIGFDFVEPIPDLVALLDRYNRNHYPTTGIWAVNAGLDDYLALIEEYQGNLPVLKLDPNPYWTGFYTARPTLKRQCRELVDDLLLAEKLSFLPENQGDEQAISKELDDAWWSAAISNHHDFITGTSPDKVVEEEQIPWLEQAAETTRTITDRLSAALPRIDISKEHSKMPEWNRTGSQIQIKTEHYIAVLDEDAGGGIASLQTLDGKTLLKSVSNDLISYRDSGGLWRMGMEFLGGIWKKGDRASDHPAQLQVCERENDLEIIHRTNLNGEEIHRLMWFSNDSPVIRCRMVGRAVKGHSVTIRLKTILSTSNLTMDAPGGVVTRPPTRIYDPTFWPLQHFVHFQDDDDGIGLAVLLTMPGAFSYQPDGSVELVAFRNATRERMFGIVGIPGNPAAGHEKTDYAFDYAFLFTQTGDWQDNDIPSAARNIVNSPWDNPDRAALRNIAASIITSDSPNVWVTAIKTASRGEGVIVRLNAFSLPESDVMITFHQFTISKAFLCDARERNLGQLEVRDGTVRVAMPGTIATIRLLFD